MKDKGKKTIVVVALAVVVAIVVALNYMERARLRDATRPPPSEAQVTSVFVERQGAAAVPQEVTASQPTTKPKSLPRLVDLGAGTCIPCKMMEPVLEGLRHDFAGRLVVEVYDVRKNPSIARQYRIRVIPTQIFIGADGKERFRHEGFMSRGDILATWAELGVHLEDVGQ